MSNNQNEQLEIMRHSLSHVMMHALKRLHGAIPGVGPAIENGFYHDFDSEYQVTVEDLILFSQHQKQKKKKKKSE